MTTSESECIVVASVLCEPHGKPGPATSTVLAFWPWFDSPEASKLAEGVVACAKRGWRTTPKNVARMVPSDFKDWVNHPTFGEFNALPLSCCEVAAKPLVKRYHDRRLVEAIGNAYSKATEHPEKVREIAHDLKQLLADLL